jgi:3-oxoadipate enol-lactonase
MYAWNGRVQLHYQVDGASDLPPLLLIQGLTRTVGHWSELAQELAQHFRLIMFDNRGVGKSGTPRPPYTTGQMAEDTRCVLDAARVDRAHVFGISLGGMVAQELALRYPERVDRLILGCTRAKHNAGASMTLRAMATLVLAGRFAPDRAQAYTAPYLLSDSFLKSRPDVLATWQSRALAEPPRRVGVFGQMLAALAHDTARTVTKIQKPTLLLTGEDDRLMPPECSRFLAKTIPGAQLEILPGAGHEFYIEAPSRTADAVRRFCG